MFKFLFKMLFYALVLIILVGGALWLSKEMLASRYLTKTFGAPSSVEKIVISANEIVVKGLQIQNPKGSTLDKALHIENIQIAVRVADLFKKQTSIQEIRVADPYIGIEMYDPAGRDNNWSRMLKHMQPETSETPKKGSKQVNIDYVLITNVEIEAVNPIRNQTIRPDPIAKIELRNVSSDDPRAFNHVMSVIIRAILKEVRKTGGLQNILEDVTKPPTKLLEKILSPFSDNNSETRTRNEA